MKKQISRRQMFQGAAAAGWMSQAGSVRGQSAPAVDSHAGLQDMIDGYRQSQMIYVAAKLRLADRLAEGPRTAEQLAAATSTHADSLYRLLRALAGLGIFAEENGRRFRLTPPAQLLRGNAPGSLRVSAEVLGEEWGWRPWGALLHSVTTGEVAFDHLYGKHTWDWFTENPAAGELFNESMDERTASEADAIVGAFDFAGARNLVDVGGGRGTLLEAILRKNRSARATLFELSPVIQSARKVLDSEMARRIRLESGDFFQSVPSGGDLYILKQIIHDWNDSRALEILHNCRRAMRSGSKLLVVEYMICAPNQPCAAKLTDIQMMVRNGGRNRTEQEFKQLFASTGFELSRITPTAMGMSITEAA